MAKEHKGIRHYTGDEIANIALGQAGFDMHTGGSATEKDIATEAPGIKFWSAFKVLGGSCAVMAQIHDDFPGDAFSTTGVYTGSNYITCEEGEIIYGAFTKIKTNTASRYLVMYRG